MSEKMNHDQTQTCPQCDNHCPADALQCGRGRKYFGLADEGHDHGHGCGKHGKPEGLAGLLHQCGRFARHADMGEEELLQALSSEEKKTLQDLLEKLLADWRARCGEEKLAHGCHGRHHGQGGDRHHHKHEH